jgi:hypothetical protein
MAATKTARPAAAAPHPFEPSATRQDYAGGGWRGAAAPAIDARIGALIEIVTRASGPRPEPSPDPDTMIDTFADRLAEAAADFGLAGMD